VLSETLELSGALMALLVGSSVFSLVFRLFGTDIWITQALANSYFSANVTAALVLLGVGFCALALDALEMIFVIIPIVAPPLIGLLRDAQQVAVLLLLVLQASFLIPPVGYAVIVARVSVSPAPHTASMWRALAPFMVIQALALILVFRFPYLVHGLDATKTSEAQPSSLTIEDQLRAIGHSRSVRGSAD
jgi:TRAP-type mannitol/chloroaromatic compound transport system permease large subunit